MRASGRMAFMGKVGDSGLDDVFALFEDETEEVSSHRIFWLDSV